MLVSAFVRSKRRVLVFTRLEMTQRSRGRPAVYDPCTVLAMWLKFERYPDLKLEEAVERVNSLYRMLGRAVGRPGSPPGAGKFCTHTLRKRVNELMKPVLRTMQTRARKGRTKFAWMDLRRRGLDEFEVAAVGQRIRELEREHGILRDFGSILDADEDDSFSLESFVEDIGMDATAGAGNSSSWCQVPIDAGLVEDSIVQLPLESLDINTPMFGSSDGGDLVDTMSSVQLERTDSLPDTNLVAGNDWCYRILNEMESAEGSLFSCLWNEQDIFFGDSDVSRDEL